MNTINNLTSSSISSQLPSFIVSEYPLFLDFIQSYYQGLERSGEPLDLVNNLLKYLDVDFYQNEIREEAVLTSNLSIDGTTVTVDSTDGFPDVDGLIQINSEIILYKTKTDTQFLSCSRGVSGVTQIEGNFEYSYSTPSQHTLNSKVVNLSYLFILYFLSKIKKEYLPFFDKNLAPGINVSNFIKNIKQFYDVKGTSKSFDFLIRALFNVSNETLYPRERLIKPSDAVYDKKIVIACKAIGEVDSVNDPLNLVGQKLIQESIDTDPCGTSIVGGYVYVVSVQRKFISNQTIYELTLDNSVYPNDIFVPQKTKLVNSLFPNDDVVTVDSTIGFKEASPVDPGFIQIENELIKYTEKTLNQFLNCTRNYCGTESSSYNISTNVTSTYKFYGYSNIDNTTKIELEILGVLNSYEITNSYSNYYKNDIVYVNKLGYDDNTLLSKNWIFNNTKLLEVSSILVEGQKVTITTENEHYLFPGDSISIYGYVPNNFNGDFKVDSIITPNKFAFTILSITNDTPSGTGYVVKKYKLGNNNIPTDVINVYDQEKEYVYIASTGVPSHTIGSGMSLGNQRHLKRIPRNKLFTGTGTTVNPGTVGIFCNGVVASSCISNTSIIYGELLSINVENSGRDYGVGNSGGPRVQITGNSTTPATARCVVNGSIKDVYIIDGGSGYTQDTIIQISGGGGIGALAEPVVNNGKITSIKILNAGTGYTTTANLAINAIGVGSGASFRPIVSGPISEVKIVNAGSGYTSLPIVSLDSGTGALASPIIFNGKIENIALISGGNNYNSPPTVIISDSTGNGTGAQAVANLTNGSITSFTIISSGINYTEGYTTITIVSSGSGCILRPNVRKWTYDLYKINTLDSSNGIAADGFNKSYGNQYSYVATPKGLRYQKNDNINSNLTETRVFLTHSPILGWAYDGNPIYGPFGYSNPLDPNSQVVRVNSGYNLVGSGTTRTNGPSTSAYPRGTFIEDYAHTQTATSLDKYNGRYCVTPDFPNGTYAYFTTLDSSFRPRFPYIIGKEFYCVPDDWNFKTTSIHSNLPKNVVRYRAPYESLDIDYTRRITSTKPFLFLQEDGLSYILLEDRISYIESEPSLEVFDYFPRIVDKPQLSVKNTEHRSASSIDYFYIEDPGKDYKVSDKINFDNTDTGGYGASAKISHVVGVGISSVVTEQFKKINYSNLNGQLSNLSTIYGSKSGAGATIIYVDYLNSNFYTRNTGLVSGETLYTDYQSSVSTGITASTETSLSLGYSSRTLTTSIGRIDTTIRVSSGVSFNVNDNLLIDDEIVKVYAGSGNTYNIYRGQFGTLSSRHSSSSAVKLLPSIKVSNSSSLSIGDYVKIDNEVFRIVDSNNSSNTISLLRSQLGSGLTSHSGGTLLTKINVSSAKINNISNVYLNKLNTEFPSYLQQYDYINTSSTLVSDSNHVGSFSVLYSDNYSIVHEVGTGTGVSGIISYTTNSLTAKGPISKIELNSGGSFYNKMPSVSINSDTGYDALITAQSDTVGRVKELSVDNYGNNLTSDYTLRPELDFPTIIKLNKTNVLDKIEVINGGTGYQYPPLISIVDTSEDNSVTQKASAVAVVSDGKIASIEITNPGYGYKRPPEVIARKTYPCYITLYNSVLNFNINIGTGISLGESIKIVSTGTYPTLTGGIQVNSDTTFYAIVGGSLEPNQLQIAYTRSNALSGTYITFANAGSGNMFIASEAGGAQFRAILSTKDFISGEVVHQVDGNNTINASGTVCTENGWISSSKILRLNKTFGDFQLSNAKLIGTESKAVGYPYEISSSTGNIHVDSFSDGISKFVDESGLISDKEQRICDSDYYQEYSYVLKNDMDYKAWGGSVKNIVHPAGFKIYSNKTIASEASRSSESTASFLLFKNQNFNKTSLSTYYKYAVGTPDYSVSLKDQVTLYDRLLTSSETIKPSQNDLIRSAIVDKIDDISSLTIEAVGDGITTYYELNDSIKSIVEETDLIITFDDILQPIDNYKLDYEFDEDYNITKAKILFNEAPPLGTNIKIICSGLNFDGLHTVFPVFFNKIDKEFNPNQVLISLNGVIQTSQSYIISQSYSIAFNEPIEETSDITILRVGTGISNAINFTGTGVSTYNIPFDVSSNNIVVSIDGIVQYPDTFNIVDNQIIFSENILSSNTVNVRDCGNGITSIDSFVINQSSNIIPINTQITNSQSVILSIDGVVQKPSSYTIGSGSTCIILDDVIPENSNIGIINFSNINYYQEIISDGSTIEYLTDENYVTPQNYLIFINGVLQTPNTAYISIDKIVKKIVFKEPPRPRTKFLGLLYNRRDPSENAVVDDISKTYFTYSSISGKLVTNDYLQETVSGNLCNVIEHDPVNKIVIVTGAGSTFGVGNTVFSGLASSVSTGITTVVTTGSGITFGANRFSVGSTSGFAVNDYIYVGTEVMRITSISSGSSFTVSRGLVATPISYHSVNTLVTKIVPTTFTISQKNVGFTGVGTTFTLTTGGQPYNYGGVPYFLPTNIIDIYGQNYEQSLIGIVNGIIQDNGNIGSGNTDNAGFTISGSTITFTEPPKENLEFYGRYIGKLRRLNDLSKEFNGMKTSFNLRVGNNIIYSLLPPSVGTDITNNLLVFINGVLQNPGESFIISGSRIIFSEAPRPECSFLGYVYIGSDEDIISTNVLQPIEIGDKLLVDGEFSEREITSIDSTNSISTLGYLDPIDGTNAIINANIIAGKVVSLDILDPGTGYYETPIILIKGGGGFGAKAHAIVRNGRIENIVVTNGGQNYVSTPQVVISRNITLNKTQRVRQEYASTYKKVTTLSTGLSFGLGTSLPVVNQTVQLTNAGEFKDTGIIKIIDDSRNYPVVEVISYNSKTSNTLNGCIRGIGFNFNEIYELGSNSYEFALGETITNGAGSTANVVRWDADNLLLFVDRISTPSFNNGDFIIGTGVSVVNYAFIQNYLSYGSGVTVIQIS